MIEREALLTELESSDNYEYEFDVRLEHFSQEMKPDRTTNQWIPVGRHQKPLQYLDPGFYDRYGKIKTGNLQRYLDDLLTKNPKFNRHLVRKSGPPVIGDKFRVALVDLTGAKILDPEFAGWGYKIPEFAWSTIKTAVWYAAFQLLNDVRNYSGFIGWAQDVIKAAKEAARNAKFSDPPKFDIFLDPNAVPPNVDFNSKIKDMLGKVLDHPPVSNKAMTGILDAVGFSYIASLMLKSGLYNSQFGGMWITAGYGKVWRSPSLPIPRPLNSSNTTALSLATFFALLGQRRLVTPEASDEMKRLFSTASWFSPALPNANITSKVGLGGQGMHEAALVENGCFRYAVAVLTKLRNYHSSLETSDKLFFEPLIKEIDGIIRKNNPLIKDHKCI